MSEITFEYPKAFLLILLFIFCSKYCKAKREALFFPHVEIFISQKGGSALLFIFKWFSIVLAITALASPVIKDELTLQKRFTKSIVLALDASGSMRLGFGGLMGMSVRSNLSKDSKFSTSLKLAKEFVKKREDDLIGLVVFGNFAYIASPVTYDKEILSTVMESLEVGIAGNNYTVINDALFQSAKLLRKSKTKSRVVILLTDGQSRGDNIPFRVVADYLKDQNIKVYTIGIGQDRGFDEEHLKEIAKSSGGRLFLASDKESLKRVYEEIDRLERSEVEVNSIIKKRYFYEYPLFLSFLSLLFYTYLLNRKGVA
jgi:Ca-activated chloride channel family protein